MELNYLLEKMEKTGYTPGLIYSSLFSALWEIQLRGRPYNFHFIKIPLPTPQSQSSVVLRATRKRFDGYDLLADSSKAYKLS